MREQLWVNFESGGQQRTGEDQTSESNAYRSPALSRLRVQRRADHNGGVRRSTEDNPGFGGRGQAYVGADPS